ncbi:serine protease 38 isoform X2 [Erinaceus europaeus]|uniref:Serine protease 38 isoform X2 n=1 Tax=Erinaceus europaeus TaxID=9365 RepID=A0A1S3AHB3_ERIEU|nr:serine protease 38 isoform X2 [Erinaceus europaeus]
MESGWPGAAWQAALSLLLLLSTPTQDAAETQEFRTDRRVAVKQDVACGQRRVQARISGGSSAPEGKWPWQASLHYAGFHICGGTIIHAYWILSAAHCFGKEKNIKAFDMYVGLVNLNAVGCHTQWFEINRVILHPTYQMYHPVGGDIALVQLKNRIEFSDYVRPVCLAPPDVNLNNLTCWSSGWGVISLDGNTSESLQEAPQPLIPVAICRFLYGYEYILPDMLCAGDIQNMTSVCEGDSGGPLVCDFNNTWIQIGVVSWGRGCLYPVFPAVYARVSYFSKWIFYQISRTPLPPPLLPSCSSTLGATARVLVTSLAIQSVM